MIPHLGEEIKKIYWLIDQKIARHQDVGLFESSTGITHPFPKGPRWGRVLYGRHYSQKYTLLSASPFFVMGRYRQGARGMFVVCRNGFNFSPRALAPPDIMYIHGK